MKTCQSHDFWESLPRSIAFKRNVPVASCLDLQCSFEDKLPRRWESTKTDQPLPKTLSERFKPSLTRRYVETAMGFNGLVEHEKDVPLKLPLVAGVVRWRGFDLLQIVLNLTWAPPLLSKVKRGADYWSPRTIWPELHVCSAHRGWGSHDRWLWMLTQKNSSLDFKTSDLSTFGFEMHQ